MRESAASFEPDDEPEALPASEGAPPRRPPTAVGAAEFSFEPEPEPQPYAPRLADLIRMLVGELAQPLTESMLPEDTRRSLRAAGVQTVADLLRLPDRSMKRLGVDPATRKYITEWRRSIRMRTR